jgi:hypothetical protein
MCLTSSTLLARLQPLYFLILIRSFLGPLTDPPALRPGHRGLAGMPHDVRVILNTRSTRSFL